MNHDACHCSDYNKTVCPKDCYRAQLTQDLRDIWESKLHGIPMSFAAFKGTKYCKLEDKK